VVEADVGGACEEPSMNSLITALQNGIHKRFQSTLESEEHRIATMLHPKFKLAFPADEQAQMHDRQ